MLILFLSLIGAAGPLPALDCSDPDVVEQFSAVDSHGEGVTFFWSHTFAGCAPECPEHLEVTRIRDRHVVCAPADVRERVVRVETSEQTLAESWTPLITASRVVLKIESKWQESSRWEAFAPAYNALFTDLRRAQINLRRNQDLLTLPSYDRREVTQIQFQADADRVLSEAERLEDRAMQLFVEIETRRRPRM